MYSSSTKSHVLAALEIEVITQELEMQGVTEVDPILETVVKNSQLSSEHTHFKSISLNALSTNFIFQPSTQIVAHAAASENVIPFDYGEWDSIIKQDPITNEPIFTYRVYQIYQTRVEVGSAEFYGQPLLCFSADKHRNNIINTSGVLSAFHVTEDMQTDEICRVLPPILFDKIIVSASQGAMHGFLRGGSNIIGFTLQSRGVSKEISNYLSQLTYYGCFFAMRFTAYLERLQEHETINDFLNAIYQAALETGQLWLTNVALKGLSSLCEYAGESLKKNGWSLIGAGLKKCGSLAYFSIFARNAVNNGLLESAAALGAGAITEVGTTKLLRYGLQK